MLSAYEITDEPIGDRRIKKLPEQVQDRIDDLYELAQSHPKQAIPELEKLVADYPHIPTFYNHLSVAYFNTGDIEKAEAVVLETYRRHPTYLFAKTDYAQFCLRKGEIDQIPDIFDHKFDLKLLYPRRSRFHITEFVNFAGIMCRYFHAIGEQETADLFYQSLKRVAPRDRMTKLVKRIMYPPWWIRWLRTWASKRVSEKVDNPERRDLT